MSAAASSSAQPFRQSLFFYLEIDMKYFFWKLKVNWLGLRYLNCWNITDNISDEENREAFDDELSAWEHFVEGWCRE